MNLKLLILLATAASAAKLSRNDVAPIFASSSGGGDYLSMNIPKEYHVHMNAQQGFPQYLPPVLSNNPSSNEYLPPAADQKPEIPQYTPVSDSVEILNPDFLPNNFGQNSKQYATPANPTQQPMENFNIQNSMVSNSNNNGAYQNTNSLPNEYLPSIDINRQTNIYSLPVDNGYYSNPNYQPQGNNVNSDVYLPSNIEVNSNQYVPPANNVGVISNQQSPVVQQILQPEVVQNNVQTNYNDNNYPQQNYNEFEPQKLTHDPNVYSQNYDTKPVPNEYLPVISVNSNQYNQQNNYVPPIVDSKPIPNQFNGPSFNDNSQITNTKSISTEYLPANTINSQSNDYTPPNNGQSFNAHPSVSTTKSLSVEYLPTNAPLNQYASNKTPEYPSPIETKSGSNNYLPVINSNSQIQQYNDTTSQIKQNAVKYLPPTVDDVYKSSRDNEYTSPNATRRYDNDFSKPYTLYDFNTVSSTPSSYSHVFSTPQVETISRSQKNFYESRTERPYFKYSPKQIEIGKATSSPKWPKAISFTTPRSFEPFKVKPQAQSRQSYVYGSKFSPLANSRSSSIGTLAGSQQSTGEKQFEPLPHDQNRFDSPSNHLRTPQPLDSIQNPFQAINQQDPQNSYQKTYPHTHNGHHSGHTTESVPILKQTSEMAADGSFSYETLTGDQTHIMQQGHIENLGTDHEEQVIHGSYSYVGDDGKTYTVTYVADANGFRASGDHIPTPPPIPEVIQRSIDLNLAEEIARGTSTPGYQYGNHGDGNNNNYQGYSNPEPLRERSSYSKDNGYKY